MQVQMLGTVQILSHRQHHINIRQVLQAQKELFLRHANRTEILVRWFIPVMDYMHLFQALLAGTISKPYQFHKCPGQPATVLLDFNINAKHSGCISALFLQSIIVFKELERKTYNSTEIHDKILAIQKITYYQKQSLYEQV